MKKFSLRQRALNYAKQQNCWINGGTYERLALANNYKASNISRRLRELHEEGLLDRREVHGTVEYRYKPHEVSKERIIIEEINGERVARIINETITV